MAATPDWPPFEFVDREGRYQGISADILRTIGQRAGFRIEPVGAPWSELYQMLREGRLDLSPAMQASPEREEHFLFTHPVVHFPHAIYTHRERNDIHHLADLQGQRVAVERDYYEHEYLRKHHPGVDLVLTGSSLEALLKVANREADAYLGNVAVTSQLISQNVLADIRMGAYADMGRLELSMGVRKELAPLVPILNKGLASLTPEDRREIIGRYTVVREQPTLSEVELAWIRDNPVIRLGVDPEFAPFEFVSEAVEYQGMASEYVALLNSLLGLNLRVVHTHSWEDATRAIQAGELDVLPCIGKDEAREAYLSFSEPYLSFHRVVISRLDMPFTGSLNELPGWSIAVQKDSLHEAFVRAHATLPPLVLETFAETLAAVAQGEVDCAVGNSATTAYWIQKLGLTNLRLVVPLGQGAEGLHFGIRKDWPELVSIINKGLAGIPETESIAIKQKWMDVEIRPTLDLRRV